MRGRGLKLIINRQGWGRPLTSPPPAGAWIETQVHSPSQPMATVAPMRGRGLKYLLSPLLINVAPMKFVNQTIAFVEKYLLAIANVF